jgi:RNA polymerase sigma-70 factor (ECF subfamily)
VGPYQLQAAIAATHAEASRAADTHWKRIAELYRNLAQIHPSPVVELNRAVVLAKVAGPRSGLDHLLPLEDALAHYQPYWAAKAALLLEAGEREAAHAAFGEAIARTTDEAELDFLREKQKVAGSGH